MGDLASIASLCYEVTVILGALALLIKPVRNKILGLDKGVSLNTVKPMAPNGFNNAKFPLPFQPFAPMGR